MQTTTTAGFHSVLLKTQLPPRSYNYSLMLGSLNLGNRGVGNIVGDSASVLSVGEADESILTPVRSPGVAHLPVSTGGGVNTDSLHGVVDVVTANSHDTTSVRRPGGGIDGDGDGSSGLHIGSHAGLTLDGGVVLDSEDELAGVSLAGSSLTGIARVVGVVHLLLNTASALPVCRCSGIIVNYGFL